MRKQKYKNTKYAQTFSYKISHEDRKYSMGIQSIILYGD